MGISARLKANPCASIYYVAKLPAMFDPLQFAYHPNRSADDAISAALHLTIVHLENKNSYVWMLLIDFCSAFNTVILQHLVMNHGPLDISDPQCNWIVDIVTDRTQTVHDGKNISETISINTGVPQGCVLSLWCSS